MGLARFSEWEQEAIARDNARKGIKNRTRIKKKKFDYKPTISVYEIGQDHLRPKAALVDIILCMFQGLGPFAQDRMSSEDQLYASLLVASILRKDKELRELFEQECRRQGISVELSTV